jgi:hypothetical protein
VIVPFKAAMKRFVRNEETSRHCGRCHSCGETDRDRGRLELQQPDRALDSLATLSERSLSKIAHFKLAKSNRSITTVMTPPRRRILDDMMIGDKTEANPSVPLLTVPDSAPP